MDDIPEREENLPPSPPPLLLPPPEHEENLPPSPPPLLLPPPEPLVPHPGLPQPQRSLVLRPVRLPPLESPAGNCSPPPAILPPPDALVPPACAFIPPHTTGNGATLVSQDEMLRSEGQVQEKRRREEERVEDIPPSKMVTLILNGTRITCSKLLLAANSLYFRTMFCPSHHGFLETNKDEIDIQKVDASAFSEIINFVKTKNNAEFKKKYSMQVLQAAAMLQFEQVFEHASQLAYEDVNVTNCLSYTMCAKQFGAKELYVKARFYSLWEFETVSKSLQFADELSATEFAEYMQSDLLRTLHEVKVAELIPLWVEEGGEERLNIMTDLLKTCVRWASLDLDDLKRLTVFPRISESESAMTLLCALSSVKLSQKIRNRSREAGNEDCILKDGEVMLLSSGTFSKFMSSHLKAVGEIMLEATNLLCIPKRLAPQVPCFLGYKHIHPPTYRRIGLSLCATPYPLLGHYHPGTRAVEFSTRVYAPLENYPGCAGFSCVAIGHYIYLMGGELEIGKNNFNKKIWRFDCFTKDWKNIGRVQLVRRHARLVAMDDQIFVIGGCGQFRILSNAVEAYCTKTNVWTSFPPMPYALFAPVSCNYFGRLFVFGSEIFYLTPETGQWTVLKNFNLPKGRGFDNAMPFENLIFITSKNEKEIFVFNPDQAEHNRVTECSIAGTFTYPITKSCLSGDCIYSFVSQDDTSYIEAFNVQTRVCEVVWSCGPQDEQYRSGEFSGFVPDVTGTTFPLVECWQ